MIKPFLFLLLILAVLTAQEMSFARTPADRYLSVRALGMGNAYTPIAKNTEALFFNPANLASNNGVNLTALKFHLGVDGVEAASDAKNFKSDIAQTIRQFYGKEIWVGAGALSGISFPNFAFAVYDSANINGILSNPALPTFSVDVVNDYGGALGFGFELVPGFKWGLSAKKIWRFGGSMDVPVSSLATLDDQIIRQQLENHGNGYSLDTGLAFTVPTLVKPTLSFTVRDVGNTKFALTKGLHAPPTDKQEMIAGISLEIPGPLMTITPVLEGRYLDDTSLTLGQKINAGLEVQLPALALRGGFHQGYWTAGVGMNLGILMLDVASYGVEMGEYPGQKEDRRYVLELTIDFGYDYSSGSFLGLNKENRSRLKQRR